MDDKQMQNVFKSVIDSLKSKLEGLDTRGQSFYQDLQKLQNKVSSQLKNKCAKQLEWFEQNGKIEDGENGLGLSVNDDIDQAEAEKRLNEFTACASKNDHGLEDFFRKMQNHQQSIEQTNSECIRTCIDKNGKEPNPFKDCITSCFNTTIVEMNQAFDSIEKKISEVNSKL
jgi:uncharacterized protein YdiU (UPF0061 family)